MRARNLAASILVWFGVAALATAVVAPAALAAAGPGSSLPAGERAVADWEARNPWQYGTDPIFSLSRGLEENGVTGGARIALLFLTVPLDLAQLPAALIAGLWGD